MNSRAIAAGLLVFSTATLLWVAPNLLDEAFGRSPSRMSRPAPPRQEESAPRDTRCVEAVRMLNAIPHPAVVSGGRIHAASLNGIPVATCEFQTHGTCADIMNFYLSHLDAHGWRDITTEHIQPPDIDKAGKSPLTIERYDELLTTHAELTRNKDTITITLEPAQLGRCDVVFTLARTLDLSQIMTSAIASDVKAARKPGAQTVFRTEFPGPAGTSSTRLIMGRGTPDELIASLAAEMRKDGWRAVLPRMERDHRTKACMFVKPDGRWAMATATHDPGRGYSRAVLSIE